MIRIEGNRCIVPGIGNLAVPDLKARAEALDLPPAEPHGLADLGKNALNLPDMDLALSGILGRDSAWNRPRRAGAYDGIVAVVLDQALPAITKVRKVDPNLKEPVRVQRIQEAVREVWEPLTKGLREVVAEAQKAVSWAERIHAEAFTPAEDADLHLLEMRDREARDVLRGMNQAELVGVIMRAAEAGRLDVFRVLENDPLGLLSLPGDVAERAKGLALDRAGLGWVSVALEDAREDAAHVQALCETLRGQLVNAVARPPFNVEVKLPYNLAGMGWPLN